MTEQEWLASTDSQAMLAWLCEMTDGYQIGQAIQPIYGRRPSDRKLRLFACACCRSVWHLLTDERSRRAVETAERFADGEAALAELREAKEQAYRAVPNGPDFSVADLVALPAYENWTRTALYLNPLLEFLGDKGATAADILRDIIGNHFRPVHLVDVKATEELKANTNFKVIPREGLCLDGRMICTPTVLGIAQAAYDERLADGQVDPARLAVLSDALEDAGCPTSIVCPECNGRGSVEDDGDGDGWICASTVLHPLLAHLRSPGPHYRGCWALDLILGKE